MYRFCRVREKFSIVLENEWENNCVFSNAGPVTLWSYHTIYSLKVSSLQTHQVYSTSKRRGKDRFHVVSTWHTREVLAGLALKWKFLSLIVLIKMYVQFILTGIYLIPFRKTSGAKGNNSTDSHLLDCFSRLLLTPVQVYLISS